MTGEQNLRETKFPYKEYSPILRGKIEMQPKANLIKLHTKIDTKIKNLNLNTAQN